MKLQKVLGSTSEIWQVFIRDSSSTTGGGLTGLTNASGSLTAYYHRDTDTTATVINLVTMTVGTFTSSGFKEIDATNMPGWYQFCPPNAALASGAKSVAIHLKGASNMAPLPIEVQLIAVNIDDSVRMGMTALPNAAAEAAGGLYTRGTGAGQINQDANGRVDVNGKAWAGGAIPAPNVTGVPLVDDKYLLGTIYSTPATAGIQDINLKNIANAAVSTSTAQLGVNAVNVGGTAQTGRDIGASVIAASVTGLTASDVGAIKTKTDSLTFTVAGMVDSNVIDWKGAAAAAMTGDAFARLGAPAGASVSADVAAAKVDTAAIKTKTDFLPSATAGAAGGVFIAGTNAATVVTTSFTTTFTGNLSGSVGSVTGLTASNLDATVSSRMATFSYTAPLDAAGTRSALGLASANLDTQLDALPTNAELATALASADDAVLAAVGALSIPTADENADALLDRADAIETGLTPRHAMRLSAAADGGKLSGGATTTNTIRNAVADDKDRIVATVDASGNRTAITYDLT